MHYCFLTIGGLDNAGYFRARELGKALIERGVTVSYIVDDRPENRAQALLHPKASLEFVTHWRPWQLLRQFLQRRKLLKKLAPDFVEVLNPNLKTLFPLIGLRAPRVVAIWDEPPVLRDFGIFGNAGNRLLSYWLARRGDIHFAATRQLKNTLASRFGINPVYLPHATYLQSYPETPSPFAERTAVYLGIFRRDWDHDITFRAAEILAKRGKKYSIVMVGDGEDRPRWQAFVDEHGLDNVKFVGFKSGIDMWAHLRHAHVELFPIRATTLNLTRCPSKTFAYAQARRPILTSRVGEVAEVLGEKATYVESTPEGFADAIERAFESEVLPDVDYQIERHSWGERAERLLAELRSHDAGTAPGASETAAH